MDKTSLGDRMKGYENVSKTKLIRRTPVIIRIDGKAFHTWTKKLTDVRDDPFSDVMRSCMVQTTMKLLSNMQNAVFAYTQSDEISILLNDWKTLTSDQWFGGTIQKIASVSASMTTAYFNTTYFYADQFLSTDEVQMPADALFDARVFNIPKEEVANYFVWRQQDATRNSVQMLGRHYFSHKQMHKKNVNDVMDMLANEKDVLWNGIDTWKKRGTAVYRGNTTEMTGGPDNSWKYELPNDAIYADSETPIFTGEREYIERHLGANVE